MTDTISERLSDLIPVLESHWRLESLRRTRLMDSPADERFDRLTRLAARVMQAPIALVSLVDERRQFFKSCVGLASPLSETRETPLSHSFCRIVVGTAEPLVVRDAHTDPLVRDHPAVVEYGIRAYAGMPLSVPDGAVIGTLCVADVAPRDWSEDQMEALRDLAGCAMTELQLRDLGEREALADEAIAEQTARLRLSLEAGDLGVFAQEPDAQRLVFDEGFARLFGLPPTPSATTSAFLARVDPAHRPAVEAGLAGLRERGHALDVMLRTPVPEGQRARWIRLRARPEPRGIRGMALFGVAMDVTERQEADLARRESDRRKDEFLAMLAHELRNPLAPIRSGAEAIGALPEGDPRVRGMAAMIGRQVTHLARLVGDLLDVSRITQGKVTLQRERVSLATAIGHGVELAGPMLTQRRHHLQIRSGEQPVWVDGDATRLAQVFGNLVGNAAKFTPPGGHIEVTLTCAAHEAVVTVRDDGMGIAATMLPEVFELFTQGAEGGSSPGGLGIGLSLVRSLVEMHGGSVRARSDGLGKGATFEVRLPLADAPARLREPAARGGADRRAAQRLEAGRGQAQSGGQDGRGEGARNDGARSDGARGGDGRRDEAARRLPARLLIVDDNEDAARSLGTALSLGGAQVQVATTGAAALAMLEDWTPDAALLDIGMPGMDGHALARAITAVVPGVLLIAVTGYGQDTDRAQSREAGFAVHLVKPVDLEGLRSLLADRLRH